jgi:hypothetical protein
LDLKTQKLGGHYKNFTRLNPTDFEYLINLVGPRIRKSNTTFREEISVQDRLAVTLRYLATGDSFYKFAVSISCIQANYQLQCPRSVWAHHRWIKGARKGMHQSFFLFYHVLQSMCTNGKKMKIIKANQCNQIK